MTFHSPQLMNMQMKKKMICEELTDLAHFYIFLTLNMADSNPVLI